MSMCRCMETLQDIIYNFTPSDLLLLYDPARKGASVLKKYWLCDGYSLYRVSLHRDRRCLDE